MSIVKMFQPRFAPLVEAGLKLQTVRPYPKRMPKLGEPISLRAWTGKPYRSKQRILRESVIERVALCDISATTISVGGYAEPIDEFARLDGFKDFEDLLAWFQQTHDLPFAGILIQWAK